MPHRDEAVKLLSIRYGGGDGGGISFESGRRALMAGDSCAPGPDASADADTMPVCHTPEFVWNGSTSPQRRGSMACDVQYTVIRAS